MAGEAPTGYSSGGMVTKLAAARIAMSAGCRMAIADGRRMNPLQAILDGGTCSWFLPASEPKTARKRWIAGSLKPTGTLVVDAGALAALKSGRSLLPAGIIEVEGRFERGDCGHRRRRRGQRGGARPCRLFGPRCQAHHGPQEPRNRRLARLSRA